MYDLNTIVAANAQGVESYNQLSRLQLWSPATRAQRAFSRRVALLARELGVPREHARALLLPRDGVESAA